MTVSTIIPASREEWLLIRQYYVGASEVAALHGVGHLSAYKLWHRKKRNLPPEPDTPAMKRGRRLEELAIQWLAEERPDLIISANPMPGGVMFVDEDARTCATPDGTGEFKKAMLAGTAIRTFTVQIKSVHPRTFRDQWYNNGELEPPLHVAIQANHEACLAGADYALIVALVIDEGIELHTYEMPLQRNIFEMSKKAIAEFWRRIEANEPYEPDFGRDGDVIKSVYAEPNDSTIDLSSSNRLAELISIRETFAGRESDGRLAAKERAPIDAEILHMLGNAEAAIAPGGRLIEAKTVHRKPTAACTYRAVKIKAGTVGLAPKRMQELI